MTFFVCLDLAPILLLNTIPQDPLDWSLEEMKMNAEMREEEKEDDVKKSETLASLEDNTLEMIVDDVFYRRHK